MAQPAFDTHRAVKALCHAGFSTEQAEALVDQINGATIENVATKADLAHLATKADLARLASKEEMANGFDRVDQQFAQIDRRFERAEQQFAQIDQRFEKTDRRLHGFATKDDLGNGIDQINQRLTGFATREDLANGIDNLEQRMLARISEQNARFFRYMATVVGIIVGASVAISTLLERWIA